MKKILVLFLCVTLLFAFTGCIDKEMSDELAAKQEAIQSGLDYEAQISCWENTSGKYVINITPVDMDMELFGNKIINGMRAVKSAIGGEFGSLTIGGKTDKGTVIFTSSNEIYGVIMDGRTEQALQYESESDLARDFPAVTEYLAGLEQ